MSSREWAKPPGKANGEAEVYAALDILADAGWICSWGGERRIFSADGTKVVGLRLIDFTIRQEASDG